MPEWIKTIQVLDLVIVKLIGAADDANTGAGRCGIEGCLVPVATCESRETTEASFL
jgi:hypothetical protein